MMGQNLDAKTLAELEAYTQAQYDFLNQAKTYFQQREEELEAIANKPKEDALNKPFNMEKPHSEVKNFPAYKPQNWMPHQFEMIYDYASKAEALFNFIEDNSQSIRQSFSNADWLHVYANAIDSYGLDMKRVFRMSIPAHDKPMADHIRQLEKEAKEAFGNPNVTFEDIAAYARFLSDINTIGQQIESRQDPAEY